MSGHTPGPWKHLHMEVRQTLTGNVLAVCETERLPFEANARLIARAPDLLQALRDVVDRFALYDTAKDDEETKAFMAGVLALLEEAEGK